MLQMELNGLFNTEVEQSKVIGHMTQLILEELMSKKFNLDKLQP